MSIKLYLYSELVCGIANYSGFRDLLARLMFCLANCESALLPNINILLRYITHG